jgi:hypothetical protein
MDFWSVFAAALLANLVTFAIAFGVAIYRRGEGSAFQVGTYIVRLSYGAFKIYIGLIILGGLGYAIKLLLTG